MKTSTFITFGAGVASVLAARKAIRNALFFNPCRSPRSLITRIGEEIVVDGISIFIANLAITEVSIVIKAVNDGVEEGLAIRNEAKEGADGRDQNGSTEAK